MGQRSINMQSYSTIFWNLLPRCEEEVAGTSKSEPSPQPPEIEQEIKPERELGARPKERQMTDARVKEEERTREAEIGEGKGGERREEEKRKKRSETSVENEGRAWNRGRESVDVFLTTEEGNKSKETQKVTVIEEKVAAEPDEDVRVFSVPQKRLAEGNIDEEYKDSAKGKFKPIIPGLSPEEWTVLVYHRAQGPEKMVHQLDPEVEKELSKEGDWARHPCCGTLCAVRNGFLRMPTEKEKSAKTYY